MKVYKVAALIFSGALILAAGIALANNVTSKVTVGQSTPSVSGTTLNNGNPITLTANTTTTIIVNSTITDNNGCTDITNGTATILIYRDAVTSSTCQTTPNNLNCYRATVFNVTSSCVSLTQINTTTSFDVWYFAQATDASSSFPGKGWKATVNVATVGNTTGTQDSASTTLVTLTALNITTSSINYGALQANTNTGATNQTSTVTDAGNSSTTLQLNANPTLTAGSITIATSSQVYSTSTFSYPGTSTQMTSLAATVSGFFLTSPTSTSNVLQSLFWGLNVPAGTATGTYSGTNVFTAAFAN